MTIEGLLVLLVVVLVLVHLVAVGGTVGQPVQLEWPRLAVAAVEHWERMTS